MCLAIPSRIERIDGDVALVDTAGQQRAVSLMLLGEPVAVGDYVLVQLGRFAYERLDAEHAQTTLRLMTELSAGADGGDLHRW